ncbi:tRNA dimethylallyltransferase, mitochondrial [Lithohypha guttulata]|nr:tRNA dimethylallyltransferase, mitochondrial [Lithohypha guttulata]
MAKIPPKAPLIVVLGPTGSGKSKLAVELATKFNGEIINADAMQMYSGLPILTNKIHEAERNGISHHLLDQIELHEKPWTVHNFVSESSRIIGQVRERGKLPVVVGGTNFYVYSLLFKGALLNGVSDDSENGNESGSDTETAEEDVDNGALIDGQKQSDLTILEGPTEAIYAKLLEVDPEAAKTWHPKDRRKVQRALEIWLQSGQKASEIYAAQKARKETSPSEGGSHLRYDPLIFWLNAESKTLQTRLDARVDTMVEQGMLEEVQAMRKMEKQVKFDGLEVDMTKGIWVAIGYKQFWSWLDMQECQDHEKGMVQDDFVSKALEEGLDLVKIATRQYANTQNRWIRRRLAKALKAANVMDRMFLLDSTNLQNWTESVFMPSSQIVDCFIAGEALPANHAMSELATRTFTQMKEQKGLIRQTHVCETCNTVLMNDQEWQVHLKSRRHQKVLAGFRKRSKRDEYFSRQETGVATTFARSEDGVAG